MRDLSFTPSGSLILVSASRDKTLRIWDLNKHGMGLKALSGISGMVPFVPFLHSANVIFLSNSVSQPYFPCYHLLRSTVREAPALTLVLYQRLSRSPLLSADGPLCRGQNLQTHQSHVKHGATCAQDPHMSPSVALEHLSYLGLLVPCEY